MLFDSAVRRTVLGAAKHSRLSRRLACGQSKDIIKLIDGIYRHQDFHSLGLGPMVNAQIDVVEVIANRLRFQVTGLRLF